MTKVKSVTTVLRYLSYLQLLVTKITGHKITVRMTKGQVKFTIQMVGQKKVRLVKTFMSNHWSSRARFYLGRCNKMLLQPP